MLLAPKNEPFTCSPLQEVRYHIFIEQLYNLKQGNCSVNDAPFKFQTGDEITIYYNTMRGSIMFEKGKESFQIRNIDTHPGENYVFVAVMEGLGSQIEIKDY